MRCRMCRHIYGVNEMQAVRAYWGAFMEDSLGRYLIIYPGGIVLRGIKRA